MEQFIPDGNAAFKSRSATCGTLSLSAISQDTSIWIDGTLLSMSELLRSEPTSKCVCTKANWEPQFFLERPMHETRGQKAASIMVLHEKRGPNGGVHVYKVLPRLRRVSSRHSMSMRRSVVFVFASSVVASHRNCSLCLPRLCWKRTPFALFQGCLS